MVFSNILTSLTWLQTVFLDEVRLKLENLESDYMLWHQNQSSTDRNTTLRLLIHYQLEEITVLTKFGCFCLHIQQNEKVVL